jgi:hypothetical protein
VVQGMLVLMLNSQTPAHKESVEKDAGHGKRELWNLQKHANLEDEVDTLRPPTAFFSGVQAVKNRGRAEYLGIGEEPLA